MALKNKSQGRSNERITMNRVETGVPEVIVCDNGSEFHSHAMKAVCDRLGIVHTHYTPTFQPQAKGVVERQFRTINECLLHPQPGGVPHGADCKPKHTPKDHPVLMEDLRTVIERYVFGIHPYRWQKVLKARPIDIWRKDVAEHPIRRPSMLKDIDTIMLPGLETRHIGRRGVELNGSTYGTTEELHPIRIADGDKNSPFEIRYDPEDLSVVHILDTAAERFVKLSNTDGKMVGKSTLAAMASLKNDNDARRALDTPQLRRRMAQDLRFGKEASKRGRRLWLKAKSVEDRAKQEREKTHRRAARSQAGPLRDAPEYDDFPLPSARQANGPRPAPSDRLQEDPRSEDEELAAFRQRFNQ